MGDLPAQAETRPADVKGSPWIKLGIAVSRPEHGGFLHACSY
jgi:hypothetical protein